LEERGPLPSPAARAWQNSRPLQHLAFREHARGAEFLLEPAGTRVAVADRRDTGGFGVELLLREFDDARNVVLRNHDDAISVADDEIARIDAGARHRNREVDAACDAFGRSARIEAAREYRKLALREFV